MNLDDPLSNTTPADVTVLEMSGDTALVLRVAGAQTLLRGTFELGVDALVRQCLKHAPPLPVELEHAIELTEEAVMPLAARFSGGANLILRGLSATLIARGLEAGSITPTALTLDQVESLFNRLLAVSLGRPASQETLPTDASFFAALLILREFMHHLHFTQVILQI